MIIDIYCSIQTTLLKLQIDAIFAGEYQWNDDNIVTAQNTFFTCASSGNGMMTRKDNDFNQAWNMGFQQIQASGRFAKLCQESAQAHGRGRNYSFVHKLYQLALAFL